MMLSLFRDFIAYFEDSAVADAIRENDVLFPTIESVHVVAIWCWTCDCSASLRSSGR
jgi:hypothetical protein